jgi:hypothetical protein
MKKLFLCLIVFASVSSFAQTIPMHDAVYEEALKLAREHSESASVLKIKQEIENKYGVSCSGSSRAFFPLLADVVTYVGQCGDLRLSIKSKFYKDQGRYVFTMISYSVKFR